MLSLAGVLRFPVKVTGANPDRPVKRGDGRLADLDAVPENRRLSGLLQGLPGHNPVSDTGQVDRDRVLEQPRVWQAVWAKRIKRLGGKGPAGREARPLPFLRAGQRGDALGGPDSACKGLDLLADVPGAWLCGSHPTALPEASAGH